MLVGLPISTLYKCVHNLYHSRWQRVKNIVHTLSQDTRLIRWMIDRNFQGVQHFIGSWTAPIIRCKRCFESSPAVGTLQWLWFKLQTWFLNLWISIKIEQCDHWWVFQRVVLFEWSVACNHCEMQDRMRKNFDYVAEQLAGKSPNESFIVGTKFTAADIFFASLAAPVLGISVRQLQVFPQRKAGLSACLVLVYRKQRDMVRICLLCRSCKLMAQLWFRNFVVRTLLSSRVNIGCCLLMLFV